MIKCINKIEIKIINYIIKNKISIIWFIFKLILYSGNSNIEEVIDLEF